MLTFDTKNDKCCICSRRRPHQLNARQTLSKMLCRGNAVAYADLLITTTEPKGTEEKDDNDLLAGLDE